jgi:hypothetical protein
LRVIPVIRQFHAIDCLAQDKNFGRSAGLYPAVSRISNPQTSANPGGVENPAPSRLEIGDTADLKICATKKFVPHYWLFVAHLAFARCKVILPL